MEQKPPKTNPLDEFRAEPKERITLYLCVAAHRQLKETAARMGMSMSQFVAELLQSSIHIIRHEEEKQ